MTLNRITIFWLLAMIVGCEAPSPSIVNVNPRFETFHVRRVAILPFEGVPTEKEVEQYGLWWRTNIMNNGEVVSDMLTTEMMGIPSFDYVERSQIRRILEERNLSITDLMQDKSATEIGELLGVDAIIVGKVNKLAAGFNFLNMKTSEISFSARMIDTRTGTVLWSATVHRKQEGRSDALEVTRQECARIVGELKRKLALEPEAK